MEKSCGKKVETLLGRWTTPGTGGGGGLEDTNIEGVVYEEKNHKPGNGAKFSSNTVKVDSGKSYRSRGSKKPGREPKKG